MIHDRAYTRAKDWSKAIRKYHIDRDKSGSGRYIPMYDNLHQFSFNKIHCSCNLCRSKTNPKNKQGHGPAMNWSIADQKKIDNMAEQLGELYD